MFGQDDTSSTQSDDISTVNPTLTSSDSSTPASDDAAAAPVVIPTPTVPDATFTPSTTPSIVEPTTTPTPTDSAPAVETPAETPVTPEPEAPVVEDKPAEEDLTPSVSDTPAPTVTDDGDLLALKKQALDELSPLLDKLDQTPEEKFKTTMMMIQATDSSNLVSVAHEAALAITDEKVRAQALLDIVNEINYFTQPKDKEA